MQSRTDSLMEAVGMDQGEVRMKDVLGNPLKVGDRVAFCPNQCKGDRRLTTGIIADFVHGHAMISYTWHSKNHGRYGPSISARCGDAMVRLP